MTVSIAILLVILVVAIVLFAIERIPADAVALGVLVTLIVTGLLKPDEAFSGFGSDTVLMIFGLLVMTAALARTGVVDLAGRLVLRFAGKSALGLLSIVMLSAAGLSAFMSNTATTAFFVPAVLGAALRLKTSPSKLLMPLAFASILASSVTLVSTSTNLVVSGLMKQQGLAPIDLFELTPVGVPIAVAGVAYMLTIGRRLIPDRGSADAGGEDLASRTYITEVVIRPGSPLAGRTLEQAALGRDLDLNVLDIIRDKHHSVPPRAGTQLKEQDVLIVEARREDVLKVKDVTGLEIKADFKLGEPAMDQGELKLVEAIVLAGSPLAGRTLKDVRFRERYGVQVLAIHRHDETISRKISQEHLRLGDLLLIQGRQDALCALRDSGSLRIITTIEEDRPNLRRAPVAMAMFFGAILAASFNLVDFPTATLIGALGVFLTGCITPEEAYRDLEWRVLILIGAMLALGVAMQQTGTAQYLAEQIVAFSGAAGPLWLLGGFFLLTVALTQPMSNQAAAAVVLPIAVQTALQLGLNPRTFAIMIAVAASCSYLTPLEPSCLMVYGPGRYRFRDFLKVGGLLTVIVFAIALLLVPRLWPIDGGPNENRGGRAAAPVSKPLN